MSGPQADPEPGGLSTEARLLRSPAPGPRGPPGAGPGPRPVDKFAGGRGGGGPLWGPLLLLDTAQPLPRGRSPSSVREPPECPGHRVWEPGKSKHLSGFPELAPAALARTSSSARVGWGGSALSSPCRRAGPRGSGRPMVPPCTAGAAWSHSGRPLKSVPPHALHTSAPLEGTAPVAGTLGRRRWQVEVGSEDGGQVEPGQTGSGGGGAGGLTGRDTRRCRGLEAGGSIYTTGRGVPTEGRFAARRASRREASAAGTALPPHACSQGRARPGAAAVRQGAGHGHGLIWS